MNEKVKYPRTPPPRSPGGSEDDVRCSNRGLFKNKQVVVTEKWMAKIPLCTVIIATCDHSTVDIVYLETGLNECMHR